MDFLNRLASAGLNAASKALDTMSAVTPIGDQSGAVTKMSDPHSSIEHSLKLAQNKDGAPLSEASKNIVRAFIQHPTSETWARVSGIILERSSASNVMSKLRPDWPEGTLLTVWLAVCTIDSTFQTDTDIDASGRRIWTRLPSVATVEAAIELAVRDDGDADITAAGPAGSTTLYIGNDGVDSTFARTVKRARALGYDVDQETQAAYSAALLRIANTRNAISIVKEPVPVPPQLRQEPLVQPKMDYASIAAPTEKRNPLPTQAELVSKIQEKVIGQKDAIEIVAKRVRGKLGEVAREDRSSKPLVLCFPGPTGTGKTELAKGLARALGVELVRFDMGEFGEEYKISNLLGSSLGYQGSEGGGKLPNALRAAGHGRLVILFDEVEKAHSSLWQRLLAFFDEGRAADSKGDASAPKDTIVIMTTNRCADAIAKTPNNAKDILRLDGFFSPEFLGRIDKIVALPKLSPEEMAQLCHLKVTTLADRWAIRIVEVEPDALRELYLGCRDLAELSGGRGIEEHIKDTLTDDFLDLQAQGVADARLVLADARVRVLEAAA
jgi:DNA polymerase III delta prime subunit